MKYYNPMMIYPAIHYTMGGIWVDYELQTISSKVRLPSANATSPITEPTASALPALMQGLADGYFVLPFIPSRTIWQTRLLFRAFFYRFLPEFAEAEKAIQDKIDRLRSIQEKESVDTIHKKAGHIMWEYMGMGRTAEGLREGLAKLKEARKSLKEPVHSSVRKKV